MGRDFREERIDNLCTALELAITSIETGNGQKVLPYLLKTLKSCPRLTQEWPTDYTKWPFFKNRENKETNNGC